MDFKHPSNPAFPQLLIAVFWYCFFMGEKKTLGKSYLENQVMRNLALRDGIKVYRMNFRLHLSSNQEEEGDV